MRRRAGESVAPGFRIGDRVELDDALFRTEAAARFATVVGGSRDRECIVVIRDGRKTRETWNREKWKIAAKVNKESSLTLRADGSP